MEKLTPRWKAAFCAARFLIPQRSKILRILSRNPSERAIFFHKNAFLAFFVENFILLLADFREL